MCSIWPNSRRPSMNPAPWGYSGRNMARFNNWCLLGFTWVGLSVLVSGCTRSDDAARAQREARSQARAGALRATHRLEAAGAEADDLVAAVSNADTATPVSLRFKLPEQPRVGQPLRLQLALAQAPGVDIDVIHVSFQPREGLDVQSERSVDFVSPAVGATQQMLVTVLPRQAGVLALAVTVLVDGNSSSIARSFMIPLIAIDPKL